MKRATTLIGILFATPALASQASSAIDTIHRGDYHCELPGDATTLAGFVVPEEGFTITTGSSYMTPQGSGSYLLIGNVLTMTSGPKRGQKYHRMSNNFLRKLQPDGAESTLRCVRRTRNNS